MPCSVLCETCQFPCAFRVLPLVNSELSVGAREGINTEECLFNSDLDSANSRSL